MATPSRPTIVVRARGRLRWASNPFEATNRKSTVSVPTVAPTVIHESRSPVPSSSNRENDPRTKLTTPHGEDALGGREGIKHHEEDPEQDEPQPGDAHRKDLEPKKRKDQGNPPPTRPIPIPGVKNS